MSYKMMREQSITQSAENLPDDEEIKQDDPRIHDFWYRIDNFYFVKNESGQKVKFHLRWAQRFLLKNLWFLNIILKARQLGFTTVICIYYLDCILFSKNKSAGIIAHTQDDAENIFNNKIKFAWDSLPEWFRNGYQVDTSNAKQLKFNNGGSIRVATSMRSDTLQYLLITELGTLSLKYPEKAKEVISGSLNTIHKEQTLIIESTAKGQSGKFYDLCMMALRFWRGKKKLSVMDYEFFFFPWFLNPEYVLYDNNVVVPQNMEDYFNKVELISETPY